MVSWTNYIPHAIGGVVTTAVLTFMYFKEPIRDWLELRNKKSEELREAANIEKGRGSNLENKLIDILEKDLAGNAALLNKLNDTMCDFKDIMKQQNVVSAETLALAKATRESQQWIERRFGGSA